MPHKRFLELLQAVEAHRAVVGLPALDVDETTIRMAQGLDESVAAHALDTESAPCEAHYCPTCSDLRMGKAGLRETLEAKGVAIPLDVFDSAT